VKKAIASYHNRKRKEAIAKMNEVAKELGFSSATDVLSAGPEPKDKPKADPVYRHPKNYALTYSGRGRRPDWLNKAKEEEGYTDEQLMIVNQ
jgi:DNA-binding protein H-NS